MKFSLLPFITLIVFLGAACSQKHAGGSAELQGEWHSKKDGSKLKISAKTFTLESDSPEPEDYFVKNDTIYTSFEGNLPYTKYAIKKLDEHNLELFTSDSTTVYFSK